MSTPGGSASGAALTTAHAFDIHAAQECLRERGGYEIGVYVLVAPEPDHRQPDADDEVYVVLEGSGTLDVEGEQVELREGYATFVPAGAKHQFVGYEQLSVLVIFEKAQQ
jgi:mannose-6-phosphate isomerase-like protein (cupin superfamily)